MFFPVKYCKLRTIQICIASLCGVGATYSTKAQIKLRQM